MDELCEWFTSVKFGFLAETFLYFKLGLITEVYLHHIWYNTETIFEWLESLEAINFEHVGTWAKATWEFLGVISSWSNPLVTFEAWNSIDMFAFHFVAIETVSPEGTFCDTVQIPSSVGDMELI